MASRNGLNPKIRGQKGIGFNRALPAPFGFDKSFKATGPSNYFTVPRLIGNLLPFSFTIEYWVKPNLEDIGAYNGYFLFLDEGNKSMFIQIRPSVEKAFQFFTVASNVISSSFNVGQWNHIVFTVDYNSNTLRSIVNGNISTAITYNAGAYNQLPLIDVRIMHRGTYDSDKVIIDEFRVYNRVISDFEIISNYNSGIGNNASITDGMMLWYKFEKFEYLDFSTLLDGTNIKLGMLDYSGKNNHGLPSNSMVLNAEMQGYPIGYY